MVTVIDSIMGSGKTTWAINYINNNRNVNILYITPYLKEIERIKDACKDRELLEPEPRGKRKLDNLNELLSYQADICSTHSLFKRINEDTKKYIEQGEYTLILDESIDVVTPLTGITKDDLNILKESNCITIRDDGFIIWNKQKAEIDSKYNDMMYLALNDSLFVIDGKVFLWQYPPEVFKLFKKVYILTYLFCGSTMKPYFDLYHIDYEIKSIDIDYQLCDYVIPDKRKYNDLINIYDGKLNSNIILKNSNLSATWYKSANNKTKIEQLKNNLYNFFINVQGATSDTTMWTVYKNAENKLKGKGYSKGYISCNCRATNEFQDRYNLAYMINLYMNPEVAKFFQERGVSVDLDAYSLSEFLQWIWRSRIRKSENINIYIPSARMRNLLKEWMCS